MASKVEKFLNVFKRKGTSKTSPDDRTSAQDVKGRSRRRDGWIQDAENESERHGQNSVDQLEDELLTLRQNLERKEAEMQELKREVSTLRSSTSTIDSVQPEVQPQEPLVPQQDTSRVVNLRSSFCSDSSQLSCLDFSLASTGQVQFEGQIKTKIFPASEPGPEGGDQACSTLPDTATAAAPCTVEKLLEVKHVSASEEERSKTKGGALSHVQALDIVDKLAGATKNRVDERKSKISEPEYVEKHCHGQFASNLNSPESIKHGVDNSTQGRVCETDYLFDYESRSPPKSATSTESEQSDFVFPSPGPGMNLDSDDLYTPQTAASLKVANWAGAAAAVPKSSSALPDLEVDENSLVVEMKDHEEVKQSSLEFPLGDQTEKSFKVLTSTYPTDFRGEHGLTIVIPCREAKLKDLVAMEDPFEVETGFKVVSSNTRTSRSQVEFSAEEAPAKVMSNITQQAVAAASHASINLDRSLTEKSLQTEMRFLELDHNKLSKGMKSLRRRDSPTRHDIIKRSTSVVPVPPSPPAAAQAFPHGGLRVPPRSQGSQAKAGNVREQSEAVKVSWNENQKNLESKASQKWRSGRQTEPMANTNSVGMIPPQSLSHGRNSFAASNPSTRPRSLEGLSPLSSSLSRSARELSPSRYSTGSQRLLRDEPGWKPKANDTERVRQKLSDWNRESSLEEIDLEEEVRQCLEQSRLLLMADASTSSDDVKLIAPASPVSRETSFSVLALSRQRRKSMEENRSSIRSIPVVQQQQEPQEHEMVAPDVDNNTLNIQTNTDDNYAKVGELQTMDDYSIMSLQRLNNAVIAYDKKHPQPACVSEALDNNLVSLSSLPRRSRFFIEANGTTFSQIT